MVGDEGDKKIKKRKRLSEKKRRNPRYTNIHDCQDSVIRINFKPSVSFCMFFLKYKREGVNFLVHQGKIQVFKLLCMVVEN